VRYGPNRLSFSTTEALQAIYGSRANTKKSTFYDAMGLFIKVPSTHATTNKLQHARKRRILSRALSDRMMPVYEGGFIELLEEFLKRFEPSQSSNGTNAKEFDLSREFMLFNFDSMGQFCFGEKFGSMQTPKNAEIIEKTHGGFRGLNAVCLLGKQLARFEKLT
jgi:cytochrome P450